MCSNDCLQSSVLTTYRVNYLSGLHEKKKLVKAIQMSITDNGFLFQKRDFELFINYEKVKQFDLIKGTGSCFASNPVWDNIKAKLFEITYINDYNHQTCVCFEMCVSSAFVLKNTTACENLLLLLKNHNIFDKFIPSDTTCSSSNIICQIEKLAELHKTGVLTDVEFETKKTELLKRL